MVKEEKVVVVTDDRADWQSTISWVIKQLGHQVKTFSDLQATMDFIENNPFDLVIIDQRLDERDKEDKSGLELAKRIRAKNESTPIFIITGYPDLAAIDEARKANEAGHRLTTRYIIKKGNWQEILLEAIKEELA